MNKKTIDATVAIPTIGRVDMLQALLESIASGTCLPAEVLLLDQSGSDAVHNLVSSNSLLNIRVATCEGRGIAKNMNLALRESSFDQILITHDDCVVAVDWVEQAYKSLIERLDHMVTGRVLAGGPDPLAVPSTISWNQRFDYTGTLAHGALYPNNMGVHRDSALNLGGFDERQGFATAAEDLDFSYRWLRSGRSLVFEPRMVVTHNDWRSPDELISLYKHYARCAGRYYGKHVYSGDRILLKQCLKDICNGIIAWGQRIRKHSPRHHDERLELPLWVPIGLIEGLVESWRIERRSNH